MEFKKKELEILNNIRGYIHDKAILIAEDHELAQDTLIDVDITMAETLIEMDAVKDDFSNMQEMDNRFLQVFLEMLKAGIPDGMASQNTYDRHMALIGKVVIIVKTKKLN